MSDQLKPSGDKLKSDYKQKGALAKELEAVIQSAVEAAKVKYFADNSKAKGVVDAQVLVSARVKGQAGVSKAIQSIIDRLFWQGYAVLKTQKDILDIVQSLHPNLKLHPSIWNKKLAPWSKKFALKYVDDRSAKIPRTFETLSGFKKLLKAWEQSKNSDALTFSPKVIISPEGVIVGKNNFTIIDRSAKGKSYPAIKLKVDGKYQYLRVDVLKSLLSGV